MNHELYALLMEIIRVGNRNNEILETMATKLAEEIKATKKPKEEK